MKAAARIKILLEMKKIPVILGPMGSGKSTFLLAALYEATGQKINIILPNVLLAKDVKQSIERALKFMQSSPDFKCFGKLPTVGQKINGDIEAG